MACSVWKVPFFPVMPWHMTLVFLSTKTAAGGGGSDAKERDWVVNELRVGGIASELVLEQRRDRDPRSLATCLDMIVFFFLFGYRSAYRERLLRSESTLLNPNRVKGKNGNGEMKCQRGSF